MKKRNTIKSRIEKAISKLEHKIIVLDNMAAQLETDGNTKEAAKYRQYSREDWRVKKTLIAILNNEQNSLYI